MSSSDLIIIIIAILVFAIMILGFLYFYLSLKEKNSKKEDSNNKKTTEKSNNKTYTKIPVFDFMEFDSIEDNMIIQEGGKRCLMVVECEGINYDLMSQIEKTSVEAGFVQFLNTLRHPIQIYTQTRTVNIGNSIENYRARIDEIKSELEQKKLELNRAIQSKNVPANEIQKIRFEIARNQNLLDYGQDVVTNIEKMSLNKNVLKKHYYIIVPYYTADLGIDEIATEEEKRNMIFAELYTRCQAIIKTLFACSMKCRVLNSNELVDLLYVAYNRDESEVYTIDKALKAGYTELYSTGPDVLDKKMQAINEEINKRAEELAKETVYEVQDEKAKKVKEKEENFNRLVQEMAEQIILSNQNYIEKDVVEESIKKVRNPRKKKTNEKGGTKNEEN